MRELTESEIKAVNGGSIFSSPTVGQVAGTSEGGEILTWPGRRVDVEHLIIADEGDEAFVDRAGLRRWRPGG